MFTIISIFSIHFPFKDKWDMGISGVVGIGSDWGNVKSYYPLASLISDSCNIQSRIPQPRSPFSDNCMIALVCDITSFHHHHHYRINTICFSLENILKLSQIHTHSIFNGSHGRKLYFTPKEWQTPHRLATHLPRRVWSVSQAPINEFFLQRNFQLSRWNN